MIQTPPASVIVVSRGRPQALRRCLLGLEQLDHPSFEVIVVADHPGRDAVTEMGWSERVKLIPFDKANISQARNLGIAHAAGTIVAFIDDDAVAEPTWLRALCAPFSEKAVAAAGGFVRGRNGISYQWKARSIQNDGEAHPLEVDPLQTTVLTGQAGRGIKTEGTNMAFRREVLAAIGGFDPAFRFYHDEADVNLRLAERGAATAIVPLAEVHHGFAASDKRRQDRVPLSLFDVGRSTAIFLNKHYGGVERPVIKRLVAERRAGLLRRMVAGVIEPGDVRKLLKSLKDGLREGADLPLNDLKPIPRSDSLFLKFATFGETGCRLLAGRRLVRDALRQDARNFVSEKTRVTVFSFSRTAVFHKVVFTDAGYWEHSGGIFGRSDRSESLFRLFTLKSRIKEEANRIARVRGLKI